MINSKVGHRTEVGGAWRTVRVTQQRRELEWRHERWRRRQAQGRLYRGREPELRLDRSIEAKRETLLRKA